MDERLCIRFNSQRGGMSLLTLFFSQIYMDGFVNCACQSNVSIFLEKFSCMNFVGQGFVHIRNICLHILCR